MPPDQQREIVAKEVELLGAKSQVGTFIYCAFAFPLFLFALFGMRDIGAILVTGIFAAFGVFGIVKLNTASASQDRFGDLRLRLDNPLPAVGGRLNAWLRLPASATTAPVTVHANLVGMRVTYGDKGQRIEEPVRGVRLEIPVARSGYGATVTIACDIPGGLLPSNDPGLVDAVQGKEYGAWELKVRAEYEGVDLERSYAIEVGPALPGAMAPQPEAPQAAAPAVVLPTAALPEVAPPEASTPPDDRSSVWLLVAANLVPIAGVAFLGWRVHEIVFLYWIENLVIGAVNVLRMRIAVPDTLPDLAKRGIDTSASDLTLAKLMLIAFFLAHYGAFCFGHGTFLASMFPPGEGGRRFGSLGGVLGHMLTDPFTLIAIIAIVVSHAYSYFHNYLGRGEYLRANLGDLMTRPYKRIVVTHVFIIAGGFLAMGLQSQLVAMLVFIALKIGFDVYFHRRERIQHID